MQHYRDTVNWGGGGGGGGGGVARETNDIHANINFGDALWGSYEYCLLSSDLDKSKSSV